MKQNKTNLWRRLYSFFFKIGKKGILRFFICFFFPLFLLLTFVFSICLKIFFIFAVWISGVTVVLILLIIAFILSGFGLFDKVEENNAK